MSDSRKKALNRIEVISKLMDSQFRIPGTQIRLGLDPILGLIPFAGNIAGYVISAFLIIEMYRNGASGKLIIKMTGNIILDAILGAIPYIGVIPDIWYKANNRNLKLLREHYQEDKHTGSAWGIIIAFLGISLALIGILLYFTFEALAWLFGQ